LEVGVFSNCNVHRHLAYAVQQIIAQELDIERLRRASTSTGLGEINMENRTNSEKSKTIESALKKSINPQNNAKFEKNDSIKTMSLKEIVSVLYLFLTDDLIGNIN